MSVHVLNFSPEQPTQILAGFLYTLSLCVDNEGKYLIHLLSRYECIKLLGVI